MEQDEEAACRGGPHLWSCGGREQGCARMWACRNVRGRPRQCAGVPRRGATRLRGCGPAYRKARHDACCTWKISSLAPAPQPCQTLNSGTGRSEERRTEREEEAARGQGRHRWAVRVVRVDSGPYRVEVEDGVEHGAVGDEHLLQLEQVLRQHAVLAEESVELRPARRAHVGDRRPQALRGRRGVRRGARGAKVCRAVRKGGAAMRWTSCAGGTRG